MKQYPYEVRLSGEVLDFALGCHYPASLSVSCIDLEYRVERHLYGLGLSDKTIDHLLEKTMRLKDYQKLISTNQVTELANSVSIFNDCVTEYDFRTNQLLLVDDNGYKFQVVNGLIDLFLELPSNPHIRGSLGYLVDTLSIRGVTSPEDIEYLSVFKYGMNKEVKAKFEELERNV